MYEILPLRVTDHNNTDQYKEYLLTVKNRLNGAFQVGTNRQTDRQTQWCIPGRYKQTDRQTQWCIPGRYKQTDKQTDRLNGAFQVGTNRQTDRLNDAFQIRRYKQTDKQTDRQTQWCIPGRYKQTDRQTDRLNGTNPPCIPGLLKPLTCPLSSLSESSVIYISSSR